MDKNTIAGLLLMAALLMGFMYCNRPDDEQQAQQQTTAQTDTPTPAAADPGTGIDSAFTASLLRTVRTYGTPAQDGAIELTTPSAIIALNDTLGAQGLTGTVNAEGVALDLAAVINVADTSLTGFDRAAAAKALRADMQTLDRYRDLSQYIGGENKTITVKKGNLDVTFASHGGAIQKVVLNKYNSEVTGKPTPLCLFDAANAQFSFEFTTSTNRISTADLNYNIEQTSDSTVLMTLPMRDGAMMGVRYTIDAEHYLVKMDLLQKDIEKALPGLKNTAKILWKQQLQRNEVGRTFEANKSALTYKFDNESPEDLSSTSSDTEQIQGNIKWVAFKNQFFSSVLIAKGFLATANLESVPQSEGNTLKDYSMEATTAYNTGSETPAQFVFYFGPNDYPLLSDLDDSLAQYGTDGKADMELNKLVPLGWGIFGWINRFIVIPVFSFLSSFISNYGIIILLLTIFIKLILFPFTYKSYRSQARMRVLAPEIKEINEQYPGKENAMRRQQETMKLYSRAGASPFSGCLPMLLQMPVLIAMFSFFPSAIELRGQSFLWAHDLSAPDYIISLPFSIPFMGDKLSLFCLLMTVVNIVYTRINMQNQANSAMPAMKWMMYLMPIMFLCFFNDYASGLTYYYFLSLLITIVQTYAFRLFIDDKKVRAEMMENAKKPRKKTGFMARLEAAQKKQEAMMREQAKQNARRRR